jgi:c(7)-type cytochrome triheme protein
MRCANKGERVGALLIAFLFVALYYITPNGIEAQTTESPPPDAPPAAENQPAQSTPQDEEEHPVAFNYLPKTKMGYVDWVAAIKQGVIHPKDSLDPNAVTMKAIDFNVIFKVNVSGLPDVVYPHYPHTLWLDCRNCHPSIFLMRAGSNPVTMAKILKGEYCGRCHGIVAFPISDCFRCHSRPK